MRRAAQFFPLAAALWLAPAAAVADGNLAQYCALWRALDAAMLAPYSTLDANAKGAQFDDATAQAAQAVTAQAAQLQSAAPDEAKADLTAVLAAYSAYPQRKGAAFDTGFAEANDRAEQWLEKNCQMSFTDDQ
jgi:hypothetical protein